MKYFRHKNNENFSATIILRNINSETFLIAREKQWQYYIPKIFIKSPALIKKNYKLFFNSEKAFLVK